MFDFFNEPQSLLYGHTVVETILHESFDNFLVVDFTIYQFNAGRGAGIKYQERCVLENR